MTQAQPSPGSAREEARRILHAMNDTPIAAMDANYYQHYAEELRLLVEDLLAEPALPTRVWTAKRRGLVLGVCETQTALDLAAAIPDLSLWPYFVRTEVTAELIDQWSQI